MSALQVKCYLLPNTGVLSTDLIAKSNEIRRFALAQTTNSGVYNELKEKIVKAYGDLLSSADELKTYWLDEENEFVCFSTDGEFQYAVDLQTAIKISKPYETATSMTAGMFKVYVVKKSCERHHSKVNQEATTEEQDEKEPMLHPGVVCDSCNKSIIGLRYKCMTCPDYDLCSECQPKGIHSHHQFVTITKPTRSGRCPFSGRHRGPHGGWRHGAGWRHYMRNHQQQNGTDQTSTSAESSTQRPNPLHETLNNFLPYLASSMPIVNDPEQLKNVGEYLKQFLDPFGIDVSYYVDNISKASESSKIAKESEKPKTSENAAAAEKSENLMETVEKPIATEVLIPTVLEKSTPTTRSSSIDSADQVITTTASSTIITKTTVAASAPVKESLSYEAAANSLKNVIEKNEADVTPKDSLVTEDSGFNLVDIEKELKFINCVDQLKSMGYTDDAGWLTRLVIAKDGNINAVLDSLHPIRN